MCLVNSVRSSSLIVCCELPVAPPTVILPPPTLLFEACCGADGVPLPAPVEPTSAMVWPGQLPSLRLNLYNVVLVLDLSRPSALGFLANAVHNLVQRGFPVRWGVVPALDGSDECEFPRVDHCDGKDVVLIPVFCSGEDGKSRVLGIRTPRPRCHHRVPYTRTSSNVPLHTSALLRILPTSQIARTAVTPVSPSHPASSTPSSGPTLDWSLVEAEFYSVAGADADFAGIVAGTDEQMKVQIDAAAHYAKRLSADLESAPYGHIFVNGKHFDLDEVSIMREFLPSIASCVH